MGQATDKHRIVKERDVFLNHGNQVNPINSGSDNLLISLTNIFPGNSAICVPAGLLRGHSAGKILER